MVSRGKESLIRKDKPIDARPHSSARGIVEGGGAYWNLVNGSPAVWRDPYDPERLAAWQLWRNRILVRWQRPGWRPSAWVAFELPHLLGKVRPWRPECRQLWGRRSIALAEYIYGLKDTPEDEREDIREGWRNSLRMASGDRQHPAVVDDVPPWFEAGGKASALARDPHFRGRRNRKNPSKLELTQ